MITRRAFGQAIAAVTVPALPITSAAAVEASGPAEAKQRLTRELDRLMLQAFEHIRDIAPKAINQLTMADRTDNPAIRDGHLFDMRCAFNAMRASFDVISWDLEEQRQISKHERQAFEDRRNAAS